MRHLYTYRGKKIFDDDFLQALRMLGVMEGDVLFIHSDIKVFGRVSPGDTQTLLFALIDVFKKSVGESGTIAMPTFSYSWGSNLPFDVQKSRSKVGALTEFFRQQTDVRRSIQPMHSVAAWGKRVPEVLAINKDTFGKGTVFENLHTLNAKIVLFGVGFEACTFLHYVEQMHQVPYRFLKTFQGTIRDRTKKYEDSFTYFARPLDKTIDNDMTRIEPYLGERGLLRKTHIGGGSIFLVTAGDLFEASMRLLDQDPYFLLTKPPV